MPLERRDIARFRSDTQAAVVIIGDDVAAGEAAVRDGADDFIDTRFSEPDIVGRIRLALLRKQREQADLTNDSLDPLTGCPNREAVAHFFASWQSALVESQEYIAVAIFDANDFKKSNDQLGHAAGDQALVHIAETLQNRLRGVDYFGRWGGDEFVAILPGLSPQDLVSVHERVVKPLPPMYLDSSRRVRFRLPVVGPLIVPPMS